jgi:hypothetical protein
MGTSVFSRVHVAPKVSKILSTVSFPIGGYPSAHVLGRETHLPPRKVAVFGRAFRFKVAVYGGKRTGSARTLAS